MPGDEGLTSLRRWLCTGYIPASMDDAFLERAAATAQHACDLARQQILPRFRAVEVEMKADGTPVTEADRAAERAIRGVLGEAYPDVGILGEEYGEAEGAGNTSAKWIIDPIDGTISFARGIPLFGTLIALLEEGEPVLGLIDLPALGERYIGWRGAGCRRNGELVHVSEQADLGAALLSHGDPICFEWAGQRGVYERLGQEVKLLRGYTDAFGHAQVLSGSVDAMVDCDLNPWDAAATRLLCEGAGGAGVLRERAANKLDLIFGSPPLVEQLLSFFDN